MAQPIIVLDRDGVINEDSDAYIKSPEEWQPIAGSIEAIASLSRSGVQVAVATNQSGLGRGLFDAEQLAQMHGKMHSLVEAEGGTIAAVCYCPHVPEENCRCRKPGVGLLQQIQSQLLIPLAGSFFIGDSTKDLEAAVAFDMRPVLVRTGKGTKTEAQVELQYPDLPIFKDLAEAVTGLGLITSPISSTGVSSAGTGKPLPNSSNSPAPVKKDPD